MKKQKIRYIVFGVDGNVRKSDVRHLYATSSNQKIFVFNDADKSTKETAFNAFARVKRSDGFVADSPKTLLSSQINTDNTGYTEEELAEFLDSIKVNYITCRVLELTKPMLAVNGALEITVVYNKVNQNGKVIETQAKGIVSPYVYEAVEEILTEDEYTSIKEEMLDRNLSGITLGEEINGSDILLGKQQGVTKLMSAQDIRNYIEKFNVINLGEVDDGFEDELYSRAVYRYEFDEDSTGQAGLLIVGIDDRRNFGTQIKIEFDKIMVRYNSGVDNTWADWKAIDLDELSTHKSRIELLEEFKIGTIQELDNINDDIDDINDSLKDYLKRDGSVPMQGELNMSALNIRSLADGSEPYDAVNKRQLDKKADAVDLDDYLKNVWTDVANQTTTFLNDELVINRGNNVYKATLANLLTHATVTELFEIVQTLPEIGLPNRIYLVPENEEDEVDKYGEYLWISEIDDYERIGAISVDLSNYYNKDEINSQYTVLEQAINDRVVKEEGRQLSEENYTSDDKQEVAKIKDKVDKEAGKGLSSEDYTLTEKNKLWSVEYGAQKNVQSDWNATSGPEFIKNKPDIDLDDYVSKNEFANYPYLDTVSDLVIPVIPDVSGITPVSQDVYRIHTEQGVTIDYNTAEDVFIFNGTASFGFSPVLIPEMVQGHIRRTITPISGTVDGVGYWGSSTYGTADFKSFVTVSEHESYNYHILRLSIVQGTTFNNYTVRLEMLHVGESVSKTLTTLDDDVENMKDDIASLDNRLVSLGEISIYDLKNLFIQEEEPTNPQEGDIWFKIESEPEINRVIPPDLTGATDLGNGRYELSNSVGLTIIWDENTGYFTFNGTPSVNGSLILNSEIAPKGSIRSYKTISGNSSFETTGGSYWGNSASGTYYLKDGPQFTTLADYASLRITVATTLTFNNWVVKFRVTYPGDE